MNQTLETALKSSRLRPTKYAAITLILLISLSACSAKQENTMTTNTSSKTAAITTLKPCPSSPNCVSSLASNSDSHFVESFVVKNGNVDAKTAVKNELLQMPRTKLIKEQNNYLHITFKTKLIGFTDDVELLFTTDSSAGNDKAIIHIRSASRVGYSDLGANRKRVESIRAALKAKSIIQ